MIRPVLVAVAAALALGGLAHAQDKKGASDAGATGVVRGSVVIAPACPGPAQPGRPECLKRPAHATVRVFRATAPSNGVPEERPVATVTTDAGGRFLIALPAGAYRLLPVPPPGIALAKPVDIAVTAGSTVAVELRIDTGLR